ncbi:MAG: very short patch repair endonuclease, partial [Candidatus Omnitrophota bacterium]
RFRLHSKSLPGKPDIVLPKYKTVVFVHGCFWHRHKGCKYAYTPKTRKQFWDAKFKDNIDRFFIVKRDLKKAGWKVIIVWECKCCTKITRGLRAVVIKLREMCIDKQRN